VGITLDGKVAGRFSVFGDSVAYPLHLNVAGVRRLRITADLHEGAAYGSGGTLRLAGSVSQLGVPPAEVAVDEEEPVPLSQVRLTDKLVRSSGIGDVRMGGSIVGRVEKDGDIRKGGAIIGKAAGVKKEHAAAIFFFGFFE